MKCTREQAALHKIGALCYDASVEGWSVERLTELILEQVRDGLGIGVIGLATPRSKLVICPQCKLVFDANSADMPGN